MIRIGDVKGFNKYFLPKFTLIHQLKPNENSMCEIIGNIINMLKFLETKINDKKNMIGNYVCPTLTSTASKVVKLLYCSILSDNQ